ncbi:MAG: hypothetical protein A2511_09010 [Deltaproteobacteria bacterium RIFOXYD12_FULL_50_9]|nr:MAG: hypothetical protein A2511_09010 [Deltaproteobacteria bacterium RIFOXYD12_FULL_50_9]
MRKQQGVQLNPGAELYRWDGAAFLMKPVGLKGSLGAIHPGLEQFVPKAVNNCPAPTRNQKNQKAVF